MSAKNGSVRQGVGIMPDNFESVTVDLGAVERTIREVENDTGWRFALPGRNLLYQLFVSLATDQGGFKITMTPQLRTEALEQAQKELPRFLQEVTDKSKSLPSNDKKEVGFPMVVHELDRLALRIRCGCWPE
jgi:hypothetical protein